MPSSASIDVVAALSLHDALPICQEGRQSGEHLRAYRGAVASEVKEALQHRGSSESHHQLPAKNPRIVDESREVLEVDAADVADLVGAVAAECRDLVLVFGPRVADADAKLEQRRTNELQLLVEEEVHVGAVGHVGEEVQLPVRSDRQAVAQREGAP